MQCPQQRVRKPYLRMNLTTTMLPMCQPSQAPIYERASSSSGESILEFSRGVKRPARVARSEQSERELSAEEQARQRVVQPKDGVGEGELQRQQGEDDDKVQRLIDPNGLDEVVARFEGVDEKVRQEDERNGGGRCPGEQDEDGGVGGRVIGVDLPAFTLVFRHPAGLKGKISHKMTGQPDQDRSE